MPGGKEPDEDVKLSIELTSLCRAFHSLPRPGGVLDQDWYHISLLNAGLHGIAKLEQKQRADMERQQHKRR